MPAVFVSHTTADHRDYELAHRLAEALGQCGARTWIAPDSIPGGAEWEERLVAGVLEECSHFLVIVSHASLQSPWVLKEIELAKSRLALDPRFSVLQLVTGKVSQPLPELQTVPYRAEFSAQLAAVLDAVGLEPRGLEARKLPLSLPGVSRAPAAALDSGWLVYRSRVSALIGRANELDQLRSFYGDDRPFLWWAIEGPGGVGKSRLALESLRTLTADWYAGFLRPSELADFAWRHWNPDQPVAIVLDDAAAVPLKKLEPAIAALQLNAAGFRRKVRLLLIERAVDGQEWWNSLCAKGQDDHAERIAALHAKTPMALGRLERPAQREALESFLAAAPHRTASDLPGAEDSFWDHLDTLTDRGRPLFIGLAAAAVADLGIERVRRWNVGDLLEHVYDRDLQAWQRLCPEQPLRERATDLIAIATATGGFDFARNEKRILERLKDRGLLGDTDSRVWETIATFTNGRTCALEPDILGEYFLTRVWRKPPGPIETVVRKLLCAWDLAPARCADNLARTIADFPEADAPLWWIEVLRRERLTEHRLPFLVLLEGAALSYGRAEQLTRMGELLEIFAEMDGRTGTEWEQLHNHVTTVAKAAVIAYAKAQRWPEVRRWLEHARRLAERFPPSLNMQFDLGVAAVVAIEGFGAARRWDDVDFALAAAHDVEKRHAHINAENLALGATLAINAFLEETRLDGVDTALAMLVRLNRLSTAGRDIAWRLCVGAYRATMIYGRLEQAGHIHWAVGIVEDLARRNPDNAGMNRYLTDIRERIASGSSALQARFDTVRQAETTVGAVRAAVADATRADALVGQLRGLAHDNEANWMLRVHLARGLAAAIEAGSANGGRERSLALLAELRDVVATIPECAAPLESLAEGLAATLANLRHGPQDVVETHLAELRTAVQRIRADFPAFPIGRVLSVGVRAALSCRIHAKQPELPVEMLDELVQEVFRAGDPIVARDLADLLLDAIAPLADAGRLDALDAVSSRLFDLMRVGESQVDVRIARALMLIAAALDRAGRRADAATLLVKTGGLEQQLEESETENPEIAPTLIELRQRRAEYVTGSSESVC